MSDLLTYAFKSFSVGQFGILLTTLLPFFLRLIFCVVNIMQRKFPHLCYYALSVLFSSYNEEGVGILNFCEQPYLQPLLSLRNKFTILCVYVFEGNRNFR